MAAIGITLHFSYIHSLCRPAVCSIEASVADFQYVEPLCHVLLCEGRSPVKLMLLFCLIPHGRSYETPA